MFFRLKGFKLGAVAGGAISMLLSRGLSLASLLVIGHMVPSEIGADRFGLWMVITSFAALAAFADFGLGLGLINPLTAAFANKDAHTARKLISNAFVALAVACLILGLFFAVLYPSINWASVLSKKSNSENPEAYSAILVFVFLYLLCLPCSIGNRILMAQQRTYVIALCEFFGLIVTISGVFVTVHFGWGVACLVASTVGGMLFASMLCVFLAFRGYQELRPRFSDVTKIGVFQILRAGRIFFALQIGVAVSASFDPIILSSFVGNSQAGEYSILSRLFGSMSTLVILVMTPFWPAFAHARAANKAEWIRATMLKLLGIGAVATGLGSFILAIVGEHLIPWWTKGVYHTGFDVLIPMAIWSALWSLSNITGTFLNAFGVVRFQLILVIILIPSSLLAKIIGAKYSGSSGLLWLTIVIYSVVLLIPSLFMSLKLIKKPVAA